MAGMGWHLPPRVVECSELALGLGLSEVEVRERSGIGRRYYAEPGKGPSDLAVEAARQALAQAGLSAEDLDLIIFATMTPDVAFPGSGCYLQDKLGCGTIGALDIRAQCTGFVAGLVLADSFVRAGAAGRVLLAGAEVHSTSLDFSPRGAQVTPRLGDGAVAAVLRRAAEGEVGSVMASVLRTDAREFERFWCEYPASRDHPVRMTVEALRAGLHYPRLDPEGLGRIARAELRRATVEVLERAGVSREDVALFVFHYVDPGIALEAAREVGIEEDRFVAAAAETGHIAAASAGIAVARAVASGRVGRGGIVCVVCFGAGLNTAAAVLRF